MHLCALNDETYFSHLFAFSISVSWFALEYSSKKIDRFRIQLMNRLIIIFFLIYLGIFRYSTIGLWKRSTILWMGKLDSGRNYPKCGLLSKLQRIWHGLENPCFGRGPGTQFCTRQTLPKKSCFYGVSSDYLSTCIFLLLGFFSCSKCI